ncbi:MAG: N-acetylmuramoyl-L-alanine amidase [Sulfitobacter sp.]
MFQNSPTPDPRLARYDHLIVHVTATRPDQNFDDHDIDQMHRNRGFNGCGYNAIIKRDGTWLDSDMGAVTRPIGRQGAHVGGCGNGWNGRSFGVSLVGGVDAANRPEDNMTSAQKNTLAKGISMFMRLHPAGDGGVSVMGHRDLIEKTNAPNKKACPCFDVMPWWAERQASGAGGGGTQGGDETDSSQVSTLVDQPHFWTVASGDTLSKIMGVTGVNLATIRSLNPEITNPNLIAVGQIIRLR